MTQPNRLPQDTDITPGSIGGTEHMERLLQHLRNLGFTEMEAKVMVELSRQNAASGYEVAKRLGASRSNVYAALQRLAGQGYLRASAGEPVRYSMLPPGELTRMIEGRCGNPCWRWRRRCHEQNQPSRPFIMWKVTGRCWKA